jgi:hypothetical protein
MFNRRLTSGAALLCLVLIMLGFFLAIWKLGSPAEIRRAAAMPPLQESTDDTLDWETIYPPEDDESTLDETLVDEEDTSEDEVTPSSIKTITPRPGSKTSTPVEEEPTEEMTPTITETPPPDAYRTEDAEMGQSLVTQPPQMVLPAKRSETRATPLPTKSAKDLGVFGYFNWRLFLIGLVITLGFGLVAVLGAQLILTRAKRS